MYQLEPNGNLSTVVTSLQEIIPKVVLSFHLRRQVWLRMASFVYLGLEEVPPERINGGAMTCFVNKWPLIELLPV